MLDELKKKVLVANSLLPEYNLTSFTWGNASGIDRDEGLVVIKPTGLDYNVITLEDLVVVNLDGNLVEGKLRPSTDLATHLQLYKAFPYIKGIVHTHSRWATSFAQAGKGLHMLGLSQADYFNGDIPCTRNLTDDEAPEYQLATGKMIVETFSGKNPMEIPAVLVRGHGVFTWGRTPIDAFHNALVVEQIAFMNAQTHMLMTEKAGISGKLVDTCYLNRNKSNK